MTTLREAAILALFMTLGSAGPASAAPQAADEQQIEQLERDRQDAFVRGDIDALDRATARRRSTVAANSPQSLR